MLVASATTLPLFLALGGCAGPDPLAGPPPLSADVRSLFDAVTAEQNLIGMYQRTIAAHPAVAGALGALLAEHEAHLASLRAMIIEPPGKTVPAATPGTAISGKPPVSAALASDVARLRAAEQSAATAQLRRLGGASAPLAQLYACIAASEATHVTALTTVTDGTAGTAGTAGGTR